MAKFFPDNQKQNVTFISHAEKIFYEACQSQLSEEWFVHYSVVLSKNESGNGIRDNEMDFILYHPKYGMIVVEVKGGKISYDANKRKFYSKNRFGKTFVIKNPFQQAQSFKGRLISALSRDGIRVPVSYAVAFPDIDESGLGQASFQSPETVIQRQHLEGLEAKLIEVIKTSQPEKYLKFEDQAKAVNRFFNGKHFKAQINLKDYINLQASRVTDIEMIQSSFITPIASQNRVAIEGEAGTGKTLLASQLAKHFSALGKKVLFLSPNEYINKSLSSQFEADKQVEVKTFFELASEFGVDVLKKKNTKSNPSENPDSQEDWEQFTAPELLQNTIKKSAKRFDVIISDESQDIQPLWWEPIEELLGSEESNLYMFFDRNQGVFASGEFLPENVLPKVSSFFPLVQNYRTTKEISKFSENFKPKSSSFKNHVDRVGFLPELITYKDEKDFVLKMQFLMDHLDSEGLESSDSVILSARKTDHKDSILSGVQKAGNYRLDHLQKRKSISKELNQKNSLLCSTIQGFKGLECNVGILVNLDENQLPIHNPLFKSLIYVAATRAKHMLYVFAKEGSEKANKIKEMIDGIQTSGSFVANQEEQSSIYLASGQVSFYDSKRFGLIKLDQSEQEILFFPEDITFSVQVGERVKCRVQNMNKSMSYGVDIELVLDKVEKVS